MLRAIDAQPFVKAAGTLPPLDAGKQPFLQWISIKHLLVDDSFQRDIGGSGKKNILRIAREFDWALFSTVILAVAGKERFIVVDGQHRVTAAALRGIEKVPCQVMVAVPAKQALAFAAINANVTRMSPMQLHAARVAASDPAAVRLKNVCAAGGVTLLRYGVPLSQLSVGQTMAVVQLRRALESYGEKALRISLQCITKTRDGNPGMVRGLPVLALCAVLESEPHWLNHPKIVDTFQQFDFRAAFKQTGNLAGGFNERAFRTAFGKLISGFLTSSLGARVA